MILVAESGLEYPGDQSYEGRSRDMAEGGVLVTGGTGKTGGALVEVLRRRGVPVRIGSRNPDDPDAVRFDWDDATTHAPALDGMDQVYLVPPPSAIDPMPQVAPFLAEIVRSGVRRVILLGSFIEFPGAPGRLELEDVVRQRRNWVLLRPSGFMQNFLRPHPTATGIRRHGEIWTSAAAGGGWIDVADIAEAAGAVLAAPDQAFDDDYVLTGPEALSYSDAAGIIATETGRPVHVVDLDVAGVAARFRDAGLPAPFAEVLAAAEIGVREGQGERVTSAVHDLTGRPPRAFADFVRQHAAEWAAPSGDANPTAG